MKRYRLWLFLVFAVHWVKILHAQELFNDSILFRLPTGYTAVQSSNTNYILHTIDSGKAVLYNDPRKADSFFVRAVNESISSGFREGLVKALNGLATTALFSGDYDEAIRYYQEALHHSRGLPLSILSDTYTGLAGIHIYKSQYTRAVWFFYKYLEMAETSTEQNPPLARTYNNLSAIWRILQDGEKQYKYTVLAEKAAIKEKDTNTLSSILFRKGIFIQDTNISLALKYHQQALAMGQQKRDNHTIIASMLNIGRAYRQLGDYKNARRYAYMADSLLHIAGENPFNKVSFYTSLGEAYFFLGMNKQAEASTFRAISIAESLNTHTYMIRAYNLLTHIYESTGNYNKAFRSQRRYIALRDSITGEQTVQAAYLVELKYLTAKQDRELALHQLAISHHKTQLLRKNIIIGSIAGAILLLATGIWVIYRNMQAKNRIQQESIRALKRERQIDQMKAIMQGEDQESIRIGQELHDGIGSMLSVIKMNLSMIPQEHEELAGSRQYQEILDLLDKTSTDLRETAHNLMLDSLLQGGLDEALQHFCEKNAAKYNVSVHFLSYGQPPQSLPQDFRRAVYRIMRELIAHSIKQKNVTLVVVQFNWQEDMLSIILEDDMDVSANAGTAHPLEANGLISRIDALDGRVDIEYGQDKGTTIDIEFDIRQDGIKQ